MLTQALSRNSIEIVNEFGGRDAYDTAIRALEEQLYAAA